MYIMNKIYVSYVHSVPLFVKYLLIMKGGFYFFSLSVRKGMAGMPNEFLRLPTQKFLKQ